MSFTAGRVTVPVVPDFSRFHRTLGPQAERAADEFADDFQKKTTTRSQGLGQSMGRQIGSGLNAGLRPGVQQAAKTIGNGLTGALRPELNKLTVLTQKAADAQAKASAAVVAAKKREADAVGQVRVAETRLGEVRASGKAKASALAAAEESHAKALRRLATEQDSVSQAAGKQEAAERALLATRRQLQSSQGATRLDVDTKGANSKLKAFETRLDRLSRGRFVVNLAIAASPLAVPAAAAGVGALAGLGGIAAGVGGGAAAFAGLGTATMKRALEQQKLLKEATVARQSAVEDLSAAEGAAAAAADAASDAQVAAARSVQDAQRGVAEARRTGAAQVATAQQGLVRAQDQLVAADGRLRTSLASLHEAREQAKRDLEDLAEKTRDNDLSAESAQIGLIDARAALRQAETNGTSTELELRKARLGVAEAEDRVSDARRQSARDAAELAKAEKAGVSGSAPVQSVQGEIEAARAERAQAAAGVVQAERDVATARVEASRQVADAQRTLTRARVDGAKQVADAQANAAAAATTLAAAQTALNDADAARGKVLAGLTPAQQKALAGVAALSAAWSTFLTSIEGPVLGALVAGMGALEQVLSPLVGFVTPVANAFGQMFTALGDQTATAGFASFSKVFGGFAATVIGDATQGIINLAKGFGDLFLAFMPLSTDMSSGLVNLTDKFATWSAGLAQSDGFKSFIGYVRETGPVLLSTLASIGKALIEIGVALAPMASAMLKGLGVVARFVASFAQAHPQIVRVVAGIAIAAAGGAALARAFAPVFALFRGAFSVFSAAAKGVTLIATAQGRATIQAKIWMAVAKAQIAITKVQTVVTRVFNAVLKNNPIGRVITVLVLLGAGLVLAYKKSETFRRIVDGAWRGVRAAASAAWRFLQPLLAAFGRVIGVALVGRFKLFAKVASAVFTGAKALISKVWSGGGGEGGIRGIFGKIGDGVSALRGVFRRAVDGISSIWGGLKSIFATPVNWVIDNVINKLIDGVNVVAKGLGRKSNLLTRLGNVGSGKADTRPSSGNATGAARNQYASGGWTGPGSRMKPAGTVHADEFVVRKAARRRFERTNPGVLDHVNRTGSLPRGYADGGFVDPSGRTGSGRTQLSRIARAQLNLAAKLSGINFRVMQGDRQPATSYSGSSHTGSGVVDTGPGNFTAQSWLRKVGFAAWGRNFRGAASAGSGAHVHSVSLLDPGSKNGSQARSYRSGGNGLGGGAGSDYGPRPAVLPNLLAQLKATNLSLDPGAPGGGFDAIGKIKDTIATISKSVAGQGNPLAKMLGGGGLSKLGSAALAWAKKKADSVASFLSPAYSIGKAVVNKLHGSETTYKHKDMARASVGQARTHARGIAARDHNWGDSQWAALLKLWNRESGFRWNADNRSSSAYGIPQALPGSKMRSQGADYLTNADTQIKWGLKYILDRYGNPAKALAFSDRMGWYAGGGHTGAGPATRPAGIVHADEFVIRKRSRRLIEKSHPGLLDVINRTGSMRGYADGGTVTSASLTKQAAAKADRVLYLRAELKKKGNSAARIKKVNSELAQAEAELAKLRNQRDKVRAAEDKAAAAAAAKKVADQAKANAAAKVRATADEAAADDDGAVSTGSATGKEYLTARGSAEQAAATRAAATLGLSNARTKAAPVTKKLDAVNYALSKTSTSTINSKLRAEHDLIVKLAAKRDKASGAAAKKKVQDDIDAARARQKTLNKQLATNADLLKQKKALEADSRYKALTSATTKYTAAVKSSNTANVKAISAADKLKAANVAAAEAAQEAADAAQEAADAAQSEAEERAAAAAQAIADAKQALEDKVTGVKDIGFGLGLGASAATKTSGGLLSSLRSGIATVGTWGAVARDLIGAGLRGPIMEEFINNGPSKEAVRFGKSLLRGGQISAINGLQANLKAEVDRTGTLAEGYFKAPGSLATGTAGSWSSAGSYRPTSGTVDMSASGAPGLPPVSFNINGMPADTAQDIADKAAAKVSRVLGAAL